MTRAFLCLGQLRIGQAFDFNPFSIPLFIVMFIFAWQGRLPEPLQRERFIIPALAIVITVWLVRIQFVISDFGFWNLD